MSRRTVRLRFRHSARPACPPWCSDHTVDDEFVDHRHQLAKVGGVTVDVSALDVRDTGRRIGPVVVVWSDGEGGTAAEARQVAAALLDAADLLDGTP